MRLITDPDSLLHTIQLLDLGMVQNSLTQVLLGEMLKKKLIQLLVQQLLLVNDVIVRHVYEAGVNLVMLYLKNTNDSNSS